MKLWWFVDKSEGLPGGSQELIPVRSGEPWPRVLGGITVLRCACSSLACFVNNSICKPDVRLQMWPGSGPVGALDTHSLVPWPEAKPLDRGWWCCLGDQHAHYWKQLDEVGSVSLPSVQVHFSLINKAVFTCRQAETPWSIRFTMAPTYLQHKRFWHRKDDNSAGMTSNCIFVKNTGQDWCFMWSLASPGQIMFYCHNSGSAVSLLTRHSNII